jgi:gamma-glutamyltranspeptidase / glutathione hydrolase
MPCKGVIAAGHELTARAAEIMLREGGNAFDAVLAAHFAACVVEPVLTSLGGGGFMTARPAGGEPVVYDFFAQTPRHKRPVGEISFYPVMADFGTAQQQFHIGQGTIATPGTVKGAFTIHRDLGSLPMTQIVAPAVRYARDGVAVNRMQAYIFSVVSPIYLATPEARAVFCGGSSKNRVLREGEALRNVRLADTIERLAAQGDGLFYRGEIAREIEAHCREHGGHLTRDDLRRYEVVKRKPLDVEYNGARVMTNPPPSSGGVLIAFALELLREADPAKNGLAGSEYLRLLAEVMALTSRARMDAPDPGCPLTGLHARLLDPRYLRLYKDEIAWRARAIRGTTQMSVIDSQGNIASMTVSNGEGCGSLVADTGVMLNNMLGEEDLNLGGFHQWAEDSRMTSMMAPTIVEKRDGSVVATGSGGSNRIRTALLQVLMNLIHFEMDAAEAVLRPRIHLEGDKLSVEGGFPPEDVERLIAHYPEHQVWDGMNLFFGGAHTVSAGDVTYAGAGDPRRGGVCRVVE